MAALNALFWVPLSCCDPFDAPGLFREGAELQVEQEPCARLLMGLLGLVGSWARAQAPSPGV